MFWKSPLWSIIVYSLINTHTPLWAPKHLCAPRIQGHKNIFMRASGHWATAMFAIFSALHDSIQASRLILRAPTVSPSIRNMYNSTACFFLSLSLSVFSVNIHSYYYQPSAKNPSKAKKKEDCLLGEQGGGRGVVSGLVGLFYSPRCPKVSYTSPMCSTCRDTYRLSHGRTLPAERSPTPILLANCQPVISNGHSGPDAHRIQSNTSSSWGFIPEPERKVTVVSMWLDTV